MSLKENGYEVVKSIDIFNELVTRFSEDFNGQYLNREDVSKNNSKESGWQKFLNIEDLCSIALVARKNLPNVEFVYNDINLEDKNKLPVLKSIIDRIKIFEEKNKENLNGKKLVDCIGTQMHLRPYITENELDYSLEVLSSYGYPLKITEYDQPLSDEYISSHSKEECELEKERKQEKIKKYFTKIQGKYNIKQLTIWTLTDSTSFLLDKKNKSLIEQGKKTIQSIYAGVFRKNESLLHQSQDKTKQKVENQHHMPQSVEQGIQIHQQIKQKNQAIKQQKMQKNNMNMNKPKVKTLTQYTSNSSSTGSKGFTNVITLSLIASFVLGALVMIVYMLIRIY